LLYPKIEAERCKIVARCEVDRSVKAVVLDAPKLVEVGLHKACDAVIFVHAERIARLRRLADTRGWSEKELEKREKQVIFEGLARKPVASLLRGFSAPVKLNFSQSTKTLMFLAQHDADGFNRWEAINKIALKVMVSQTRALIANKPVKPDTDFLNTLRRLAMNDGLDPALRALALTLPTPSAIANEIGKDVDPVAVQKAHDELTIALGKRLGLKAISLIDALKISERNADELQKTGIRKLKNTLLGFACAARTKGALEKAKVQFSRTHNMSDRLSALNCLLYRLAL